MALKDEIKKLDAIFSKYIRLKNTNNGFGICATCGQVKKYEQLDCGHFISREHLNTRWNEQNVHIQCQQCNRFKSGKQYEFSLFIDKKYGLGTSNKILNFSRIPCKPFEIELKELTKQYKSEVNKMLKKNA